MPNSKKILIFDLDATGHHSGMIMYLIMSLPRHLEIQLLTCGDFLRHKEVLDSIASLCSIKTLDTETQQKLDGLSGLKKSRFEWAILQNHLASNSYQYALLMYMDHLQPAILLGPKPKIPTGGLIFRSTLAHYTGQNFKERLFYYRKNLILKALKLFGKLDCIFLLDPFGVPVLNKVASKTAVVHLPDPFSVSPVATIKKQEKKVLLVFGHLDERKALEHIIQALALLPQSVQRGLLLNIVGKWQKDEKTKIDKLLSQLTYFFEIKKNDHFIADADITSLFHEADIVLGTYKDHIGMSGILNRSAEAQKPIIVHDYGLMAALTRQRNLGVVVNAYDHKQFSKAILDVLNGDFKNNPLEMAKFAEENAIERFAEVIAAKIDQRI